MAKTVGGLQLEPGERVLRRGSSSYTTGLLFGGHIWLTDCRLLLKERWFYPPWRWSRRIEILLTDVESCKADMIAGLQMVRIRTTSRTYGLFLGWFPLWNMAERWCNAILDAKAALEREAG